MKTNFIGGKLKLKNQKNQHVVQQIRKVFSKEIKLGNKEEKEISNEVIVAGLNEQEEKYMNELVDQINGQPIDTRTEAERLFDERRMKRIPEKIKKSLATTYKQRYEAFNKQLSKLPEHYDIPKVGPG
jgi:protein FAM32A